MGRFGVRTVPAASRVRIGRWAGLEAVGCIERFLSGIGVEAARDPDARLDVGLQVGQGVFHQQTADALTLVVRMDDHVSEVGVGAVVKEDAGDAYIAVSVADGDDGGGVGQDLFRLGFCQQLKVDGRAQLAKRLRWQGKEILTTTQWQKISFLF